MRTRMRAVFTVCLVAMGVALAPLGLAAQNEAKPLIVLHADSVAGIVSPLIFGANYRWAADATGSADPESGMTYPLTVEQIKDVGISLIRYPAGALANVFQWQRAVGPRARRGQQVSGLVTYPAPLDSGFGPDEFGDLLDKTGAVGILVINFATASAADAANFVAYMSAPIGSALVNGVDWASRRAANRHPKPYKIAYVDIGNEYEPAVQAPIDQNYWIKGEPTSINAACAADKISCLYAFGGSTRFEHQPAVQLTDWREPASVSSGEPRQTLYARYAPVATGSETVWVEGVAWQGLSDLAAAAADAKVYRINYQSAAISFGDGVHGAIPPKGSSVTVSYTSGPHEGFVDFYRAIKAVNPSIKVCASIHDESFIRIMGAQHVYDCIQQHPYAIGNPEAHALSGGLDDFFVHMASRTIGVGAEVQLTQQLVKKYAGANAAKVEMVLSEYGQAGTFPAFAPHFARSEGDAVLNALCLREWVLAGVAAAARTSLTDYTFKPIPAALAAVQFSDAESARDFALFAGPGPDTIVTPPALAIKLLRQHTGNTLLASSIEGNPKLSSSKGDAIDALQTYATRDALGNAFLVVINVDPKHDIKATVRADAASFGPTVAVATLASRDLNDENNPKSPQFVSIVETNAVADSGTIDLSFPKHSVTGIKLSAVK
jgi:alpha-L-arabinofuranosidase